MATRDQWREHVTRWEQSGLSATKYSTQAGVDVNTLRLWKWKFRQESQGAATDVAAAAIVELRAPTDSRVELELARGRRLRIPASFDPTALRRLIDALESTP